MNISNLSNAEILENLECLSKAELLDTIYDEVFNNSYDELNNKCKLRHDDLVNNANIEACKVLESVEDLNCNELVEYIKNEFM